MVKDRCDPVRVYFRPLAADGSQETVVPSNTDKQEQGNPASWVSKIAAKQCLGSFRVLDASKNGSVLYRLIEHDPETEQNCHRGSFVVSLDRDKCTESPGIPESKRKIDWDFWKYE